MPEAIRTKSEVRTAKENVGLKVSSSATVWTFPESVTFRKKKKKSFFFNFASSVFG
jgi:hypothetical protein